MAPTVSDGVVYAGGACLFALDSRTGRERWRVCPQPPSPEAIERIPPVDDVAMHLNMLLGGAIGYSDWGNAQKGLISTTPVVDDGIVYFGDSNGALYAAYADTGQLKWSDVAPGLPYVSSPLMLGADIWAGSINKRQYVFDRETGQPLWHFRALSLVLGPALLKDDVVYFADESLVYAMPLQEIRNRRGDVLWDRSYYLAGDRSARTENQAATGMVYIVDAYPTVKVESPLSPILLYVGDETIFVAARDIDGGRGYLAAVERSDGSLIWRVPLGIGNGPAAVAGGCVVVAEGEEVAGFSPLDGTELWRTRTGIASAPVPAGDAVYVGIRAGDNSGAVAILSLATGVILSRIDVDGVEGLGAPAVANGQIIVGSVNLKRQDGYLFAFDDPVGTHAETVEC